MSTIPQSAAPMSYSPYAYTYSEDNLPESDGRPMAETEVHRDLLIALLTGLKDYYRDDPRACVTGNILVYFRNESGDIQSVSPDLFVVRGIEKKKRRIYKVEDEGKAPEMVIELTSTSTKMEDLGNKRFIYAYLGVKEYFLFDPLNETLRPVLRGYRLQNGEYVQMPGAPLKSEVLGLELRVQNDDLRLYDPKTGLYLLKPEEVYAARRIAEVEAKTAKAKAAIAKAEIARTRIAVLESENARLLEEIARLQAKKS